MATVRFALVGVCYISEEHAQLSGPPCHRDTLGEGMIFSFLCMCALSLLWPPPIPKFPFGWNKQSSISTHVYCLHSLVKTFGITLAQT